MPREPPSNEVLLSPVVSEEGYGLIEDRKYSFRVHPDAHQGLSPAGRRGGLRREGAGVNIIRSVGKPKRRGMVNGRKPGWKKAIVQRREGQSIEIFEGAQV